MDYLGKSTRQESVGGARSLAKPISVDHLFPVIRENNREMDGAADVFVGLALGLPLFFRPSTGPRRSQRGFSEQGRNRQRTGKRTGEGNRRAATGPIGSNMTYISPSPYVLTHRLGASNLDVVSTEALRERLWRT
jgi:hypothetical protein